MKVQAKMIKTFTIKEGQTPPKAQLDEVKEAVKRTDSGAYNSMRIPLNCHQQCTRPLNVRWHSATGGRRTPDF